MQVPVEIEFALAWFRSKIDALHDEDSERGELLPWVVMTALIVAGAIIVVGIIIAKAKSTANNTKTQ